VATATDGCNVIGRHNFLAQKLEAKIVSLVSVHSHAYRFGLLLYCRRFVHGVRNCASILMQLWKRFTVSPFQSACLAMHQITIKTRVARSKWTKNAKPLVKKCQIASKNAKQTETGWMLLV